MPNTNWRDHPEADKRAGQYYAAMEFTDTMCRLGLMSLDKKTIIMDHYWSNLCPY